MCANIAWICGLTINSNASFCVHHTQFLDFGFFRSEDYRSSYPKVLLKQLPLGKDVLKICSKFTAEHLFFFNHKGQKKKKKNTLVSGNAGDEKNLHPGNRKFIFLNWFSGDILFSFLVPFAFLGSCFFFFVVCLLFFQIKNV